VKILPLLWAKCARFLSAFQRARTQLAESKGMVRLVH
jgi:hypothetical protein